MLDRLVIAAGLRALLAFAGSVPGWALPLFVLAAGLTFPLSFGGLASMIPDWRSPRRGPRPPVHAAAASRRAPVAPFRGACSAARRRNKVGR